MWVDMVLSSGLECGAWVPNYDSFCDYIRQIVTLKSSDLWKLARTFNYPELWYGFEDAFGWLKLHMSPILTLMIEVFNIYADSSSQATVIWLIKIEKYVLICWKHNIENTQLGCSFKQNLHDCFRNCCFQQGFCTRMSLTVFIQAGDDSDTFLHEGLISLKCRSSENSPARCPWLFQTNSNAPLFICTFFTSVWCMYNTW